MSPLSPSCFRNKNPLKPIAFTASRDGLEVHDTFAHLHVVPHAGVNVAQVRFIKSPPSLWMAIDGYSRWFMAQPQSRLLPSAGSRMPSPLGATSYR
jgi:hypothetical protein